jgi:hypothetical protein
MTGDLTSEMMAQLVARIVTLDEQIAQLREAREILAEPLRALEAGSYVAGPHTVSVQSASRLNAARFERAFPANVRPDLYKLTPDLGEVRRHIADVDLAEYMDASTRLVIK